MYSIISILQVTSVSILLYVAHLHQLKLGLRYLQYPSNCK